MILGNNYLPVNQGSIIKGVFSSSYTSLTLTEKIIAPTSSYPTLSSSEYYTGLRVVGDVACYCYKFDSSTTYFMSCFNLITDNYSFLYGGNSGPPVKCIDTFYISSSNLGLWY